jgi:hypothetical protein
VVRNVRRTDSERHRLVVVILERSANAITFDMETGRGEKA